MQIKLNPISDSAASTIGTTFRGLLEQKHLYQSLSVDFTSFVDVVSSNEWSEDRITSDTVRFSALQILHRPWRAWDPESERSTKTLHEEIPFRLDSIKATCSQCEEVAPFNLKRAQTLIEKIVEGNVQELSSVTQVFGFVFECQSCRSFPEVFMVRREGLKLTLTGRAPIEKVLVPTYVPKAERKFFSDAIVAHQSGQTLAGLFLLRTFIEQFTRRVVGIAGLKADEVLEHYMDQLADDFKSRFPSLKEIYSNLSGAIHSADPNSELFEDSMKKIDEHFDARRLFKIE